MRKSFIRACTFSMLLTLLFPLTSKANTPISILTIAKEDAVNLAINDNVNLKIIEAHINV